MIFTVHGRPHPQPRPRFVDGRVVSTADRKTAAWKALVVRAAREALANSGGQRLAGAVRLEVEFRFKPPAKNADRIGKPHTQKPDADNLAKLVMDALTAARVFGDDALVAETVVRKVWHAAGGCVVDVAEKTIQNRAVEAKDGDDGGFDAEIAPDWL